MEPPVKPAAAPQSVDLFSYLPDEATLLIFGKLDARSVCKAGEVCTDFRRLTLDRRLWVNLWQASFNSVPPVETEDVKAVYLPRVQVLQGTSQAKKINSIAALYSMGFDDLTVILDTRGMLHIERAGKVETIDLKVDNLTLEKLNTIGLNRRCFMSRSEHYISVQLYSLGKVDLRVVDLRTGAIRISQEHYLDNIFVNCLHLHKNHAVLTIEYRSYIYDVETLECSNVIDELTIACDKFLLIKNEPDNQLQIYKLETGEIVKRIENPGMYYGAFFKQNILFLSKYVNNGICIEIWDTNIWSLKETHIFNNIGSLTPRILFSQGQLLGCHSSSTSFTVYDRKSRTLISLDNYKEANTQKILPIYSASTGQGMSVSYLEQHNHLIFAGTDYGYIAIFDPLTGKKVKSFTCPQGQNMKMYTMRVIGNKILAYTNLGIYEWTFVIKNERTDPKPNLSESASTTLMGMLGSTAEVIRSIKLPF